MKSIHFVFICAGINCIVAYLHAQILPLREVPTAENLQILESLATEYRELDYLQAMLEEVDKALALEPNTSQTKYLLWRYILHLIDYIQKNPKVEPFEEHLLNTYNVLRRYLNQPEASSIKEISKTWLLAARTEIGAPGAPFILQTDQNPKEPIYFISSYQPSAKKH